MIHPAARRRRKQLRETAQIMRNVMRQQRNDGEGQRWTWWQQLIGVELLIGVFVIVWYTISFCYQLGYHKKLLIPLFYSDFSLYMLVRPSLDLLVVIFYVVMVLLWFFTKHRVIKYIFVWLFISVTISNFRLSTKGVASLLLLTLAYLLLTSFRYKKKGKYDSFVDKIKSKEDLLYLLFFVFVIILFTIFSSALYGWQEARNQDEFYVINGNSTQKVILDTYKDNYIVAPLNCDHKTFKPEFELISMNDKSLVLKYMKIGPLSPGEPKTGCKKR